MTNKTLADNRISLTDQVLKGTLIQNKLFESNKYYVYGAGMVSTDLINAVELAAQYDNLKGKKFTFIISPQWFTNHGLTNQNFDARMSQSQINQMFNQKICQLI